MFTVYSKEMCPMCDKAKALLTTKQQEFEVIQIVTEITGENQITREKFMEQFPGIRAVPYIVKNDGSVYKTFAELAHIFE